MADISKGMERADKDAKAIATFFGVSKDSLMKFIGILACIGVVAFLTYLILR